MSLFVRARNVQRVEQSRGTLPPEAAHPLARVQTSRAGFCLLQKNWFNALVSFGKWFNCKSLKFCLVKSLCMKLCSTSAQRAPQAGH